MQQHAIPEAPHTRTVRQPPVGGDHALQGRWKPSSPRFHTARWDSNADPLPVHQSKIRLEGARDGANRRIIRLHLRGLELGTQASHRSPQIAARKLPEDFPSTNAPRHADEDPRSWAQELPQVTRYLGKILYVIEPREIGECSVEWPFRDQLSNLLGRYRAEHRSLCHVIGNAALDGDVDHARGEVTRQNADSSLRKMHGINARAAIELQDSLSALERLLQRRPHGPSHRPADESFRENLIVGLGRQIPILSASLEQLAAHDNYYSTVPTRYPPPLVSVILPTYDRMEFLPAAVESVLRQTHTDWEMIIADDGSGPETSAYLRGLADERVRLLWLPHSGCASVVRNAALRVAQGAYLAFMDSDDIWAPTKLEVQLRAMQTAPNRRWSYTALTVIDTAGRPIPDSEFKARIPYDGDILEQVLTVEAILATPAVMAERSLVDEAGGFDDDLVVNEDYDLWMRLAMLSPVTAVAEPLVAVRHKNRDPRYRGNQVGAVEGWVRLYGKMDAALTDPRLRRIARRRRAHFALELSRMYRDAGDRRATRRTLRDALAYSWTSPRWVWRAFKVLVSPLYRRLMRRA
jgi:glycosyltransferase involved in cell wall biosynthesis